MIPYAGTAAARRPISARDLPDLVEVPLSDEQLAAATAPMGPQLIVAGAGTGKTTVMAARVAWLVATGQVPPAGVLGLTFTNKATGELRARIRRVLARVRGGTGPGPSDPDAGEPTVMTYHSFAGQFVTDHGLLLGMEPASATLTDALRARMAYRVACSPGFDFAPDSPLGRSGPGALAENLLALDDALADLDVSSQELRDFDAALIGELLGEQKQIKIVRDMLQIAGGRRELADLVDRFREVKAESGRQDFADQVRLSSTLAAASPTAAAAVRARYPLVLLDEYQDTSRAQRRMMQSLCGPGHAVTAVGDPCQAIYGWRGASVTNIDEFPRHFPDSDGRAARVDSLTVNRRSASLVVDLANHISTDLRSVHTHMRPLAAATSNDKGGIRCGLLETHDDEIEWLSDEVVAMCTRRGAGEIAVLCRTNRQITEVAEALSGRGVPIHIAAKQALLQMPQVREVIGILRLLIDPYANPDTLAHLTGPRWRIGPGDLALLGRRARELAEDAFGVVDSQSLAVSLLDAIADPGGREFSQEARERFAEFSGLLSDLGRLRGRPVVELAERVVSQLGIPGLWADDPAGDVDASVMSDFLGIARDFESLDGERSLAEFISYVDDCERFSAQPGVELAAADDRVTLMTVHGSKGLEFPAVVLPFLSAGVFPAARGRSRWPTTVSAVPQALSDEPDDPGGDFPDAGVNTRSYNEFRAAQQIRELRDEDRLAYVAVTRAKQELVMSGHWWGPSQAKPRGPSDYLSAARDVCQRQGGTVVTWAGGPPDDATSPVLSAPDQSITWPRPMVSAEARQVAAAVSSSEPIPPDPGTLGSGTADLDPQSWPKRVDDLLRHLDPEPPELTPPQMLSVSNVVSWHRDPGAFAERLARPMPSPVSAAALAGTAVHEWIAEQFGQQMLFDLDEFSDEAGDPQPGLARVRFQELFQRTPFAERVPVAVEHPFTVQVGGMAVTGQIDAVFANDADFEIVDWKTGSRDRCDPYQLALYRHAWCEIAQVPPSRVRACFVFLNTGEVDWHHDLPDLSELPGSGGIGFGS